MLDRQCMSYVDFIDLVWAAQFSEPRLNDFIRAWRKTHSQEHKIRVSSKNNCDQRPGGPAVGPGQFMLMPCQFTSNRQQPHQSVSHAILYSREGFSVSAKRCRFRQERAVWVCSHLLGPAAAHPQMVVLHLVDEFRKRHVDHFSP